MSEGGKVVSLKGGAIENERLKAFVQSLAASFDLYVADNGFEPDAVVFTFCGLTQPSQISWDIQGGSQDGVGSILAFAAVHMLAEAQAGRQGLEAVE